jgi:osmotically-inducible protein OsmY
MLPCPAAIEIENQVFSYLDGNPQVRPRNLQVRVAPDTLVLDGLVDSWFAKQIAQESIRRLPGVSVIDNRLVVTNACH